MLRWIVALLLAANLAWLAWAQGWLRPIGFGPQRQGEPERVAGQWRPEAVRVQGAVTAEAAHAENTGHASAAPETPRMPLPASAPDAPQITNAPDAPQTPDAPRTPDTPQTPDAPDTPDAPNPPDAPAAQPQPQPQPAVCLQAGVFSETQAAALRRAAAALPEGSWQLISVQLPSRWMVYTGKLASAEAVAVRRRELRAKGIDIDRPGAALEPGLSLGRFSSEDGAHRALADFTRRGVSGLRVVRERRDASAWMLRLPAADAAMQAQWDSPPLRRALAGKPLRNCE